MIKNILVSHIAAGFLALIVGFIVMRAQKFSKLHRKCGMIYFYLMTYICVSGAFLALMNWEKSAYLFYIAIFSYAFCLWGFIAVKRRKEGWITPHIRGMLGSYIAIVTALLVTNVHYIKPYLNLPSLFYWLLPTIIGTPFTRIVIKKWEKVKLTSQP